MGFVLWPSFWCAGGAALGGAVFLGGGEMPQIADGSVMGDQDGEGGASVMVWTPAEATDEEGTGAKTGVTRPLGRWGFIHTAVPLPCRMQGCIAKRSSTREFSIVSQPLLTVPGRSACVACGRPGQLHGVVFSITHAHLREGLPASGSASTPPWSSYWALFAVSVGGGVVLGLLAVFVFKYQGTLPHPYTQRCSSASLSTTNGSRRSM